MNMRVLLRSTIIGLSVFGLFFIMASCATRTVTRVSADTQIDLSGRWNDVDSQAVAEAMIADALKRPWHDDFQTANSRKPVVIVGVIHNRSDEHIDTSLFTKNIERELINSGKVSFVASDKERDAIRNERMDQQTEADAATIKRLGNEVGADFILQGQIASQTDQVEGRKVTLYQTDLELINIETNEKVWIGSKQIKKDVTQSSVGL